MKAENINGKIIPIFPTETEIKEKKKRIEEAYYRLGRSKKEL